MIFVLCGHAQLAMTDKNEETPHQQVLAGKIQKVTQ